MGKGSFWDKTGNLGKAIGGEISSALAAPFGKKAQSAAKNIGGEIGAIALPAAGAALALKTGGRVPGKKNAPKHAIVHGGEFMLPVGVPPTAAQKKAVAALKSKAKKKK